MSLFDDLLNKLGQGVHAVEQGAANLVTPKVNAQGQGNLAYNVLQPFAAAQNFIEHGQTPTLPTIHQQFNPFDPKTYASAAYNLTAGGIVNPIISTAGNTYLDLANNFGHAAALQPLPSYSQQRSPFSKIGYQAGGQLNAVLHPGDNINQQLGINQNLNEALGNAGAGVSYLSNFLGGAKVADLAAQGVKNGLKPLIVQGAKEGAALGGMAGFSQGLADNRSLDVPHQLAGAAVSGLGGAALGGAIGGSVPIAAHLPTAALEGGRALAQGAKDLSASVAKPFETYAPSTLDRYQQVVANKFNPNYRQTLHYLIAKAREGDEKAYVSLKGFSTDYFGGNPAMMKKNTFLDFMADVTGKGSPDNRPRIVAELNKVYNQGGFIGAKSPEEAVGIAKDMVDPNINVDHLNIPEEAKQGVKDTIATIQDAIQAKTGHTLTNREALQAANQTSSTLKTAIGRDQTLQWEAKMVNLRQQLAKMAKDGTVTKEYLDALKTVKSQGTDIARKLQSLSIGADPNSKTAKELILSSLMNLGHDTDQLLKAAEGVDFNDAKQATAFYRQFVAPTTSEYLDAIRYNSMLSSPNTHINNAFGNIVNVGLVAPAEKTLTGAIDFLASKATGRPRAALTTDGVTYSAAASEAFGEAAHAFADVMRGRNLTTNLDVNRIPLGDNSLRAKVVGSTEYVGRLLEASDQFFTKLAEAGQKGVLENRQAKGITIKGNIDELAAKDAAYRLFRQDLHDPTQGPVLDAVDFLTGQIQRARASENPVVSTIAKFTLPFVKTPMNIIKQGVEYSPFGVATIPGAANKTEQVSKVILGSSAMAATATLVASGRSTWAAPTSAKQKDAFYAAGMQPYSVKIGDKWVSYTKLPPALSFPIAMVAALHDAQQNRHLGDSQLDQILTGMAKTGAFFSDQSYLKSIGDLVNAAKGDPTSISKFISNYPQQLIPYRALLSWIERLTDPSQHMVDNNANFFTQQFQQIAMAMPGLADFAPLRTDQSGSPVPNQNRVINAVSPLKVTVEDPANKATFDLLQQQAQQDRFLKDAKANPDLMSKLDAQAAEARTAAAQASSLSPKQTQTLKDQKSMLQSRQKIAALGNKTDQYNQIQGQIDAIDHQLAVASYMDKAAKLSTSQAKDSLGTALQSTQKMNYAVNIYKKVESGDLTTDEAAPIIQKLGVDQTELKYKVIDSLPTGQKADWVWEEVSTGAANPTELIQKKALTSAVVDQLEKSGRISADQAAGLKSAIKSLTGVTSTAAKKKSKDISKFLAAPTIKGAASATSGSFKVSALPALKKLNVKI